MSNTKKVNKFANLLILTKYFMKRKLQIIPLLFVIFSLQLKAQTPLTTAIDFTATYCNGQEIKLFDILDRGQYVLLQFFFTDCTYSQQETPHVKEAYERLVT